MALEDTSFQKRGKVIPFVRATLTPEGCSHEWTAAGLALPKAKAGKTSRSASKRPRPGRAAAGKRKTTRRASAKRTTTTRRKRAEVRDVF